MTKRHHDDVSDSEGDSDDDDPTGILRARAAAREAEHEQRRDDLAEEVCLIPSACILYQLHRCLRDAKPVR